jgi:translation initiation factor RLI1
MNVLFFVFKSPPDWHDIIKFFRGSELQNYFTKILEENLKAILKPQYVDQIPRAAQVKFSLIEKENLQSFDVFLRVLYKIYYIKKMN